MQVLIADDDAVSHRLLQACLAGWGYQVTAAASGGEAWTLFDTGHFPIVISDWNMPGLTGPELIRRIRAANRPGYVYTMLLTARTQKADLIAGMEAGADDFLTKPFDRDELKVRLRAGERIIRLEGTLLAQNRALEEKNAKIEADLQLACEVQQALLPQKSPCFPLNGATAAYALRFFHRYRPTGAVGGDFFDVFPLSDTLAGIFICDVMGHGVPAALVTAMIRALVQELLPLALDPGRFLTRLNRELLAILGQTSVSIYLSAFAATADAATGQLRYADAGHPMPLHVRRSAGTVAPLPMRAGMPGPPLAVFDQAEYVVHETALAPVDLLILFTAGLYEVEGPNRELYGEDRLRVAVQERVRLAAPQLFDELLPAIQQFAVTGRFTDDVCLLGMEVAEPDLAAPLHVGSP